MITINFKRVIVSLTDIDYRSLIELRATQRGHHEILQKSFKKARSQGMQKHPMRLENDIYRVSICYIRP